jgi:hypothetical protein
MYFHSKSWVIIFLFLACFEFVTAQKKITNAPKPSQEAIQLLDAVSRTTVAGAKGSESETHYELSVVWKSKNQPREIYWRNGDKWQLTVVYRITRKNIASDQKPIRTDISPDEINTGDTLLIMPISGGRFFMPENVRATNDRVALFVQLNNKTWEHKSINKFTKLPDIIMP